VEKVRCLIEFLVSLILVSVNVMRAHVQESRFNLRFGMKDLRFEVQDWDRDSYFGASNCSFHCQRLKILYMEFD